MWLRGYQSAWLRSDVVAGIVIWSVVAPQAVAYAQIAGLPPQAGLMAAPAALLAYAGNTTPLVATSPAYVQAHERDSGVTWAETDVDSIYGCQTDPATTPQCAIEGLTPDYSPLN